MDAQWVPQDEVLIEGYDPFDLLAASIDVYLAGDFAATDLLLGCVRIIQPPADFLDPAATLWRRVTMHVAMYLAGDWAREALDDSLAQILWEERHELPAEKTVMFASPQWKELLSRGQVAWPMGSEVWPKPPRP